MHTLQEIEEKFPKMLPKSQRSMLVEWNSELLRKMSDRQVRLESWGSDDPAFKDPVYEWMSGFVKNAAEQDSKYLSRTFWKCVPLLDRLRSRRMDQMEYEWYLPQAQHNAPNIIFLTPKAKEIYSRH
jgi:hypothetical protein